MNLTKPLSIILFSAFTLLSTSSVEAQNFNGVRWSRDKSNSPRQDKSGSGKTPSTRGATNNQSTYTFEITTTSGGTQRQEWQFERRKNYTQMEIKFRVNTNQKNFNKVGIAQCHDDQTGSKGVFSIYQVRKSGSKYYFGVQGDTRDANNGYSKFKPVEIKLGTWYVLKLETYTKGRSSSFERARLSRSGRKIWDNTLKGGGDSESYYKIGAYRLSGGSGKVSVSFDNIKFYNGRK